MARGPTWRMAGVPGTFWSILTNRVPSFVDDPRQFLCSTSTDGRSILDGRLIELLLGRFVDLEVNAINFRSNRDNPEENENKAVTQDHSFPLL